MHGLVTTALKRYLVRRLGSVVWNRLLVDQNLAQRDYVPRGTYPDREVIGLVSGAASVTCTPMQELLEDFGRCLVPELLKSFGALINPSWRTLDVIEHSDATIHRAVRLREPDASPPRLALTRSGPDEVVVEYSSARGLCSLAKGIIRGIADHFGDKVSIEEPSCRGHGSPCCVILVSLEPPARDAQVASHHVPHRAG